MAPRPDLPRSLRRSADARAVRAAPPDHLISAAAAGILTRANTEPGTRGRQAVDRLTYQRRTSPIKRKYPDQKARELVGHEQASVREHRSISVLFDRPAPYGVLEQPTRGEAWRAGRYLNLTRLLAQGKITPQAFRHRVAGWAPIRGENFLADPDRVLAVLEARRATGLEVFEYQSGRPA
ncbi:MAG: hypothetical protein IVW52_12540 [Acidimicrobiales bacterium]|nr:hypothetical protein [Acidimicrobiales bacterium]